MVTRRILLGIALIALSMVVFEIVLTRVFSAVMWYHFAVLSISLAMFGTAASGILLYALPRWVIDDWLPRNFGRLTGLYAVSLVVGYLAFLGVTPLPRLTIPGVMNLALLYIVLAVPFFFGGGCLAAAIAVYRADISRVYFVDLVGAALGCLVAIVSLNLVGAPAAVLVASLLASIASWCFEKRSRLPSIAWLACLLVLFGMERRSQALAPDFLKHQLVVPGSIATQVWTSHSRVAVDQEHTGGEVFGWGFGRAYDGSNPGWRRIDIDAMAATPLTRFDGNLDSVRFLQYDVTSVAFQLAAPAPCLIVGAGGGRDVLTALVNGHGPVTAVEMNEAIVRLMRTDYAAYSGQLYHRDDVTVVVDEARSFLSKHEAKFPTIVVSAVDTWAASQAGALALSENALYTREGLATFLGRLAPGGILSMTRFYDPGDARGEILRLVNSAIVALEDFGIERPAANILLVAGGGGPDGQGSGVVNMIVKLTPYTQADLARAREIVATSGFRLLYAPDGSEDHPGIEAELLRAPDRARFVEEFPLDISVCTDDKPFFFQLVRPGRLLDGIRGRTLSHGAALRIKPLFIIAVLLAVSSALSALLIVGPLRFVPQTDSAPVAARTALPFVLFFGGIGVAFMLVEIGLMQRLSLVLGHPVNSLAVILFSLLLWSGIGSRLTAGIATAAAARRIALRNALLLAGTVVVVTLLLPAFQQLVIGMPQLVKAVLAAVLMAPLGILMGTLLPLGIKAAGAARPELIPWCWAANGAASVTASVAALIVALLAGVSTVLLVGAVGYALAAVAAMAWPGEAVSERP